MIGQGRMGKLFGLSCACTDAESMTGSFPEIIMHIVVTVGIANIL